MTRAYLDALGLLTWRSLAEGLIGWAAIIVLPALFALILVAAGVPQQ